jgi:predicted RNA-binding Zn-ribbon protein involved in translation (DUF1610 family)
MKAIYEICTLWDKEICNREELVELHQQREKSKNLRGNGQHDIRQFNEICCLCKFPLQIEARECPSCGNAELQRGITRGQLGAKLVYNYNCEECGRILYSHLNLD